MNDPTFEQALLTIPEVADFLRVSMRTVHNLRKGDHPMPCVKIGQRVLITRNELNNPH